MWNKSITLTWENKKDYENAVSAGNWLVWRYTKSQGESSKKIIATLALSNKKFTDSEELIYDTEYGYFVSFKPNDWNDNDFANDLSSSDNEKIVRKVNGLVGNGKNCSVSGIVRSIHSRTQRFGGQRFANL